MRQNVAGILHSRILPTLVLAFVMVSQGGAAHQIRGGNNPGVFAAAHPHSEPTRGYSSHAPYGKECLNCHAPVGCLAANRCADCHLAVARAQECTQAEERAETENMASMPPDTDTYQMARVEPPEPDNAACDMPQAALSHEHLSGFSLDRHKTGFDGAPLTCESCHMEGLYDSGKVACAGCHAEEAPAYMAHHAAEYGDGCAECHDGKGGTARLEVGKAYPLGGAHAEAGCQACHTGSTFADEVRACSDCHEEPEVHAGQTGERCDWCHTAVSWEQARLMEHTFRLDHGDLDEADCEACHAGTYETYTCNGCHQHQSAELQERHAQEGIDQLEPCGRCHPTGVRGEAQRLGHRPEGQSGGPEAPGPNLGGQSPTGGPEITPPDQEGGEGTMPAEGATESIDGLTQSGNSTTAPTESTAEPKEGLESSGGSEEPAEAMTGATDASPEYSDASPEYSEGLPEVQEPGMQPGDNAAGE